MLGIAAALLISNVAVVGPVSASPAAQGPPAVTGTAGATASAAATPTDPGVGFVPDVREQFDALGLRPDGLAFHLGDSPDPSTCKHYQGVERVNGPDGTPYLFVTRSGNAPGVCPHEDDDPGNLLVVRMGSRDHNGERLRSNRMQQNSAVGFEEPFLNTPPDARDTVVTTISFDGGGTWPEHGAATGWPAYGHPGAMQLVGDVLAVAMEAPYEGAADAAIMFLDVSDPETPRFLSVMYPGAQTDDFGAGTIGLAPVAAANGECCDYLLVVTGKSNGEVRFFKSFPTGGATTTDLRSSEVGWIPVESYTETEIEASGCLGADWPTATGEGLQTMSFVREGSLDGDLYIIGAHNNVLAGLGDDVLRLYEVVLSPSCPFRQVRSKRVSSYPVGGLEDSANLATGASAYVSPSGELIVYATDYDETEGPFGFPGSWAPVVEYRHLDLVRPDSPTLRPTATVDGPFAVDEGSAVTLTGTGSHAITKAWIQLFEDTGAGTDIPSQTAGVFDSEWWLSAEFVDRAADDFDHLDALDHDAALSFDLDFEENADSWRWWAPPGCTISANDYPSSSDSWPGPSTVLLRGTGAVEVANDLDALPVHAPADTPWLVSPVPAGVTASSHELGDDIEGVTFQHEGFSDQPIRDCDGYYDAAIGLEWDLDGDQAFERVGTAVSYSAAALDGPVSTAVRSRATHPNDPSALGTGDPVTVPVTVRNVAPLVQAPSVTDPLGHDLTAPGAVTVAGLPVDLGVAFTDPGVADTQTGHVDWGDGASGAVPVASATGGTTGTLDAQHVFTAPGTFEIAVTITDDDGGATVTTTTVEVLSIADLVEHVADEITSLIEGSPGTAFIAALRAAVADLVGNRGGRPPTNGAIDQLDVGDPVAAITKLAAAVAHLGEAEAAGAGDLSALQDLLGLAAEAIAVGALADAREAVGVPTSGEAKLLARIEDEIARGHALLAAGSHPQGFELLRRATARAVTLAG